MALFQEGFVSGVADLTAYEANLPEVAAVEGIDLTTKLRLAQTEVAAQLEAAALRPGNVYFAKGAGWQSTGGDANLSRFDLGQVVVTPPLKLWHTFQTLALIYRDVYNRRVNDKYLPKWNEYKELARWASDLLFQTGIGIHTNAIPRPDQPNLDWVTSSLGPMALFVRITWLGNDGSESAGSREQAISVPANNALRVTPGTAPAEVSGWNVYVGTTSGEATRQNAAPLELATPWVLPPEGPVAGQPIGDGQLPEVFRTVPRFVQRG